MGADPKMANARQVWLKISQQGWDQFSQRDLWQHVRRSLRLKTYPNRFKFWLIWATSASKRSRQVLPEGPGLRCTK